MTIITEVTARQWNHTRGEFEEISGTVELTINVEKITQRLGAKALVNSTREAREFNGLLHAKAIRRHAEASK